MKKNILIYITIFAVSILACTEDMDKEVNIEKNNSSYDLSENEALEIAQTFHESVTSKTRSKEKDYNSATFNIKSIYRLHISKETRTSSNEELPLIYEIEMDNSIGHGRIIVSGDKRCQEVLAYIPLYSDSLYQTSVGPNAMIQMAKNALMNKIRNYKTASLTRSRPVESVPGEVSVMIVPFCTTNWHQFNPYNESLPKAFVERYERISPNRPGGALYGNYPTGQASIALAQTLAYLRPYLDIDGIKINWQVLTTEKEVVSPNEKMVGTLLKYVYNTIGAYPVWGECYNYDKWTATGPSTEIVNSVIAVKTTMKNIPRHINNSQCGLACDNHQKWNLDIIKKSLLSFFPVFAGDVDEVAFLVDGYAINEENEVYLHCNFGIDKRFNGYYWASNDGSIVFEVGGYFYRDITLGIISNIRNK